MDLAALRTDTRYAISPQLTSTDYPDADLDRNLNNWYRRVNGWIFAVMGSWEHRLEIATTDLVSGQGEYVLPTDCLKVSRVEVKFPNATEYIPVTNVDDLQIGEGLGNTSFSFASVDDPAVRFGDNSLFLYPIPDGAVVAGLRLEYEKDVVALALSTDSPDLFSLVQTILSKGAASNYALTKEMYAKKKELDREIYGIPGFPETGLKYELETAYAQRNRSTKTRFQVRQERFN